jgi:uncharacterized membrane protein YkoI
MAILVWLKKPQLQGDDIMNLCKGSLFIGLICLAGACSKAEQNGAAKQARAQNAGATAPVPATELTRIRAEQIVLEKFPGAALYGTELESEEGKWVYSVDVRNADGVYEVVVDAQTGDVIEVDNETAKFQEKVAAGRAVEQTFKPAEIDAAEQAALSAAPGRFQQWKAKADSGRVLLHFNIQTDSTRHKTVVVAAGTNEIVRIQ